LSGGGNFWKQESSITRHHLLSRLSCIRFRRGILLEAGDRLVGEFPRVCVCIGSRWCEGVGWWKGGCCCPGFQSKGGRCCSFGWCCCHWELLWAVHGPQTNGRGSHSVVELNGLEDREATADRAGHPGVYCNSVGSSWQVHAAALGPSLSCRHSQGWEEETLAVATRVCVLEC